MSDPKGINRHLPIEVTDKLVRRFWAKVDRKEPTECWQWLGAMRNGYGALKHQGRVLSAHRLSFVLSFGEPKEGLVIGHKCDNRECCNPAHLEAITPGKNNRDARDRRDFFLCRGEEVHNSVLTEGDVRKIKKLQKETNHGAKRIAKDLGLPYWAVRGVVSGKNWKHITEDVA